jgi:hypothetical protein
LDPRGGVNGRHSCLSKFLTQRKKNWNKTSARSGIHWILQACRNGLPVWTDWTIVLIVHVLKTTKVYSKKMSGYFFLVKVTDQVTQKWACLHFGAIFFIKSSGHSVGWSSSKSGFYRISVFF